MRHRLVKNTIRCNTDICLLSYYILLYTILYTICILYYTYVYYLFNILLIISITFSKDFNEKRCMMKLIELLWTAISQLEAFALKPAKVWRPQGWGSQISVIGIYTQCSLQEAAALPEERERERERCRAVHYYTLQHTNCRPRRVLWTSRGDL